MTDDEKIREIFGGVSDRLTADFDRISRQVKHRLSKGHVREGAFLREFLEKYVPRNVAVAHNGEIVTTSGETSNECDLILYEPRIPPLFDSEEYRIIPIEAVYGVVEVKSKLDSNEIEDAHRKIKLVKTFRRDAYDDPEGQFVRIVNQYGRAYHYFPVVGFVFAYDSIELPTLAERLTDLQADDDVAERVDSVWVLNKGMIVNAKPEGGIETSPLPTTALAALQSDDVLLWLAVMLQDTFQTAFAYPFRLVDYLSPSFPVGEVLNGAALNRAFGAPPAS